MSSPLRTSSHGVISETLIERTLSFVELDDTICYCFHVSKRKIVNYIRIYEPKRASQLSDCGGAGTGCGWCVAYLKKYFAEAQEGEPLSDDTVSADDYARQRGEYIRAGRGVPAPGAIPPPELPDDK